VEELIHAGNEKEITINYLFYLESIMLSDIRQIPHVEQTKLEATK
jgi:hypothetical protein